MATLSSDQLLDSSMLTGAGRLLHNKREEIIAEWERRVRQAVSPAATLDHAIIIDTLPSYLDNLAEALSPDYPRMMACQGSTILLEHGGERARMTAYSPGQVVEELQILREIVLEKLEGALTAEEKNIVLESFNQSIRESATAFALVQGDIREQFIATLTHDLRNPIGVIKMAAELAFDELDNKRELVSLLTRIVDSSNRAERMIRDLLDATLVKSGGRLQLELAEFDITAVTTSLAKELSLVHGKRIVVHGEPIKGFWSEDALRRAIENLCLNAIKYGDTHSPISIAIVAAHDRLMLSVHNEGAPIPAEEQEAIFQVFRRTQTSKGKSRGWGLGLSLVRGVAESHGGSISVDSAEGRGTTFMIDIPCDARPYQDAPILK